MQIRDGTKDRRMFEPTYDVNGKFHSLYDFPARYIATALIWYKHGVFHRENAPAIIWKDGVKEWWVNGKRHRTEGPAIMWENGHRAYYTQGELHRDNGPAVIYSEGVKEWWIHGRLQKLKVSDENC